LNLKELREILQMLEEKEITEFELEEEGMKLRVRKAASTNHTAAPAATPFLVTSAPAGNTAAMPSPASAGPAPAASRSSPSPAPAGEDAAAADSGLAIVKSPIVGTFYRAPDPNSPSFVNVGDHIRVGQVLCIIEAMKLMNEIEAEVAGEVLKVHHENGHPVQYGEPLFTIRLEK
jgi:acetyl-CoA carboxylase biotin carboxyl carrier protein